VSHKLSSNYKSRQVLEFKSITNRSLSQHFVKMADTEMNEPVTPTSRKRPYRGSMQDGSMEHSVLEIEELMKDNDISPTTKKMLGAMSFDIESLRFLDKNSIGFVTKQCELLRAEKILGDVLAKDEKYKKLSFSYEKMVDEGRILNFGDYHKGNLFVLKSTAREYVKGLNKGREKEERTPNPLGEGKSWKEIIEILEKEKKELDDWRSSWPKTSPAPEQPLSEFVTAVGGRCPIPWRLDQALFEMKEYQQRNAVAHTGIDNWIAEASAENDPNSEKWRAVCQYIMRDQDCIQDNVGLPAHISGKERKLWESLQIFLHYHFKIATSTNDKNGAMMPKEVIPSDIYFPPPVYSSIELDVTKRVLEFKPFNRYERGLKKTYMDAEEKLKRLEGELKIAQEEVSMKIKSIRKAKATFAQMQNVFISNEKWLADNPHEDYEIEEDTENEDEDEVDEDSEDD